MNKRLHSRGRSGRGAKGSHAAAPAGEFPAPEVELAVERLVWGGDGLGRSDGRIVFVPMTAPGDVIRARLVSVGKSFSRGIPVATLRPSPSRIAPPCALFGDCGGCQWQHISCERQVLCKGEILEESLRRIGGMEPPGNLRVVPSPLEYGYRHRARLHVSLAGGSVTAGFYHWRSRRIVPFASCPVLHDSVNSVLKALAGTAARRPSVFRDATSLTVAVDFGGTRASLSLRGRRGGVDLPPVEFQRVRREAGDCGVSLALPGSPSLSLGPGPSALQVDAGSFAQANLRQNLALVKEVTALLAAAKGEHVLDLYCGTGNFSLPAASSGARVLGVELDAAAVAGARGNAERLGLGLCSFVRRRAEDAVREMAAEGRRFDAVLLNPPREGCRETAVSLPRLLPARVVMVSCNPTTFARDASSLRAAGYRLSELRAFDMFPQTFHFETVGLFVR